MGTLCLALLLIVTAIGIDGLQPMTAHRSNADQHYHQREKDAKVDIEDDVAPRQRVGCMKEAIYNTWLCYEEGC